MVELEFDYDQSKMSIQANLTDDFRTIINKYCQKAQIDKNTVTFWAHSVQIKEDKMIIDVMNQIEKRDMKMYITVFSLYLNDNQIAKVESKEIICPKCFEKCRIKIEDYSIILFDCKNNHITYMSLDKFKESQKIDLSQIKCDFCNNKRMENSFDYTFYYCLNCKKNICILCKAKHKENHIIINYEQKEYKCPIHFDSYFKYCYDCKINICMLCNQNHSSHKLENFENVISNPDSKRIELDKLKEEIDNFNNNVKKIINGLNQIIQNMETYYQIFNNIYNNYNVNNKNYQVLKNVSQINLKNNIYKEISEINISTNYFDKINKIFNIYYKMKGKNNKDPFNFF